MRGVDGWLSGPVASITSDAVSEPREVSTCQRRVGSSHAAPVSSWPKRRCGARPRRLATLRRYAQISGCREYVRVQPGFGSKENEYRCEGTSHWQPGYVFACQVPPRSSARSSTTKSSIPASLRRIAMPRPANPAPTIAMRTCAGPAPLPFDAQVMWSVTRPTVSAEALMIKSLLGGRRAGQH